jgi:Domain of unknown function (DUF1330)
MKAFVVAAETIRDDAVFAAYRKQVPATLEAFGGRFVARGGALSILEGEWPHFTTRNYRIPIKGRCGSLVQVRRIPKDYRTSTRQFDW